MGFIDRLRSRTGRRDREDRSERSRTDGQSEEPQTDGQRGELRTDGGSDVRTRGGLSRLKHSDAVQAVPFWLPPALLMGWFVYGAVGWNLLISLTDWSGLSQPDYTNLTLEMYTQMPNDPSFVAAFRNTVVLLVAFTVVSLVIGLVLAILVDQNIRFENTLRTIYLLPMALSFVVTAIFWSWMYNPSTGTINVVLSTIGLDFLTMDWIGDPRTRLAAIIFALTWQFSGYAMVVYLAGLRAIPDSHYEAAKVDGAGSLRMYWRVIVPQLSASTTSAAVVLMVFALKAFDFIFIMFGDNPGRSADILAVMMFRVAFSRTQWAYGAAVATILFLMALSVVAPYLYLQYKRGDL
ncbi:carbohydrate ABC transporter permease [Natrialba swarupiae]|uniref:Sugar ABC transporter permease n=1 Tax=Natrialba swarupiae TaxID=2448032 RepID=A0A5D5AGI7_9EURY|nr:sugar ABC transporter permease [Natrialba swarupiae]TYT60929.1 sugar ABC transporter permease [Natrialba swarupiae]